MSQTTDQLLAERGKTHGDYTHHARCTQAILRALQAEKNWDSLPDEMKETLHMVAHKMGRVVSGDPYVKDHWDDMAGYPRLVSQRIDDGRLSARFSGEAIGGPASVSRVNFRHPPSSETSALSAELVAEPDTSFPAEPDPTELFFASTRDKKSTEERAMDRHAEKIAQDERPDPLMRRPIHVYVQNGQPKPQWMNDYVDHGDAQGQLWSSLYCQPVDVSSDGKKYVMIYAYRQQYGKEVPAS